MAPAVRSTTSGGVARLTLDRPRVRNALDLGMVAELERQVAAAVSDAQAHLLLLDAEGPAFCAGMDLKSVDLGDPGQAAAFANALARVYLALLTAPKPVLCAVAGPVSGGGVGLVAAADLVWAGPGAGFALPETRLGLVPALVSVPLRRRVGPRTLGAMALGGLTLDAQGALAAGLADHVVADDPSAAALAFCQELLRDHAPGALARTRRFLVADEEGLERKLAGAAHEFEQAVATVEARRGLAAFKRKESVKWDTA